ncbi:hypothetical protein SLEP1_g23075 [Rubroshorea leprosula]|uniref:BED-type domain-containing protein n=1 Tax=Rubroshorea leprosula TaxID=152421 RepID=A0AAV5JGI7_9ROSI|nr:hypothetical protein SLEP1_g23075 [Rubroshorea leprosula]
MEEMQKTKGKQTEEDDEEYKEDLEEEEEEDDEEDDIDDSLGKSSEGNITRAKESTTNKTKKRGRVSQKNQPPEVNEQSQPQGTQRKPRGKTSEAWKYFVCFIGPDGKQKGRCKWCSAVIRACSSNNGTSGLKKHITRCKLNLENLKNQAQLKLTKFTTIDGGEAVHLGQWKFDGVASRKAIAVMIILDELPFSFVEKEGFLHFCKVCLPQHFKPPSRRTITRDILALYCDLRDDLSKFFKDRKMRVSLTTDTWTSQNKISYMSLTAHFIDDNWNLQRKILCFVPVDSHKGEDLGDMLERCLREWGIDRVYCITVDNASANDVLVSTHCKHIANLVIHDGMKLYNNSVESVRACCKWVRQSTLRVKTFKDAVAFEEIDFKKNVCLDVPHRWNSSYDMLQRAEKYEQAFARLARQEKTFRDELNAPSAPGIPDFEDWENIRRLTRFLEHFYLFTLKVSGSWYCTINLLLHELCEINTLINKWESSKEDDLAAVAWNMKEKFAKYWGDPTKMNKNIFFAVVLDPSQKMGYLNCLLGDLYSEPEGKAKEYGCWIEAELRKLFDFYKTEIENQNENCGSNSTNATSGSSGGQGPDQNNLNHLVGSKQSGGNGLGGVASLRANKNGNVSSCQSEPGNKKGMKDTERFRRYLSEAAQEKNEQSELDIYLKDKLEIMENDAQFYDVLSFWRLKSGRFPVLAAMARDILAILVSTVASESAFSTSGRVLDDFRSSLTPKMAQALVCAQYWLRKKRKHVNITLDCEDLDELEEAEAEYRKKLRSSLLDG